MSDPMGEILESMYHGDSPIELRMQVDSSAHDKMLAQLRTAALERLEGDRLKTVLEFIESLGG